MFNSHIAAGNMEDPGCLFSLGFYYSPSGRHVSYCNQVADGYDFLIVAGSTVRVSDWFCCFFFWAWEPGILAGISPGFNAFITPFLVTVRSVPVISRIL